MKIENLHTVTSEITRLNSIETSIHQINCDDSFIVKRGAPFFDEIKKKRISELETEKAAILKRLKDL